MGLILQVALALGASYPLWLFYRSRFRKSPLADLPGPPAHSFLLGNIPDMFNPDNINWHYEMTKKYGRVFKIYWALGRERLYITDPRALHHILVTEPHSCERSPVLLQADRLLLGNTVFSAQGEHHVKQRKMLLPAFSPASLRELIPTFHHVARELRDQIANLVDTSNGSDPVETDFRDRMYRFALESVGRAGFGYSLGLTTEEKDEDQEYVQAIQQVITQVTRLAPLFPLLPFTASIPPALGRFLWSCLPFKLTRNLQQTVDTMYTKATEIVDERLRALQDGDEVSRSNIAEGKDIMSVLLKANAIAPEGSRLSKAEIIGQLNAILFGANDATNAAFLHILHLLAAHPAEQAKIREEIMQVRVTRGDGDLVFDWEQIEKMEWLDAVVKESLRIQPSIHFSTRRTQTTVVIPFSHPVSSQSPSGLGTPITQIAVPKGTDIVLGIAAANRDPELWGEDAEEWRPERWLGRKVNNVGGGPLPGIYSGIMTFLGGRRSCLGFRFAVLVIKITLITLLESFALSEPRSANIVWVNSLFPYPTSVPVAGTQGGSEDASPSLILGVRRVDDGRVWTDAIR